MSALFIQSRISVGASGALFGLLGGMLSELITNWTIYANKVNRILWFWQSLLMNIDFFWISHLWHNHLTPSNFYVQLAALLTLIVIIIINLAVGILPHVDNFAHIGGFLSGFLLGFVFLIRPQFGWVSQKNSPPGSIATTVKSKHKTYQYILWVLSVIILVVGYVPRILSLYVDFMYLIVFPAHCLFSWRSLRAGWEFFWITSFFVFGVGRRGVLLTFWCICITLTFAHYLFSLRGHGIGFLGCVICGWRW